jgi:hypothetical protein
MVKRFFHIRYNNAPRGGATVYVEGHGDVVHVSVSYCSINDQFCRKTGRLNAQRSTIHTIPLKGLPGFLKKVGHKVMRKARFSPRTFPFGEFDQHKATELPPKNWRQTTELWNRDWSFSKKYFEPKLEAVPA